MTQEKQTKIKEKRYEKLSSDEKKMLSWISFCGNVRLEFKLELI